MRNERAELEKSILTGRFAEERSCYIRELLNQGWKITTLLGISRELKACAARLDIASDGGVAEEQIIAAADAWMREARHTFTRPIGPHRARTTFINDARRWLAFLGLLRKTETTNRLSYLVNDYCSFLKTERDLAPATISTRRTFALQFLDWFEKQGRPFNTVSIADVDAFLALPRQRQWSRRTTRVCASCLRSFFEFANAKGWCRPVARAIDSPRIYKDEGLPLGPRWVQVQELITNIGLEKPADIRDRAILLMLSSYGFRSKELRDLCLDDLDWQHEKIRLHRSKRRRIQQYPLTQSAGDAILLYLQRVRPPTNRREVFLKLMPPFGPLTQTCLAAMVRTRFQKAKIKLRHHGPHALRHACAMQLMAKEFSLKEIGDYLGHTSASSTTVYAKVDLKSLRKVAEFDLKEIL